MKFRYVKTYEMMYRDLSDLWDQEDLYKFVFGKQWIENREREICECLTDKTFHEIRDKCRVHWWLKKI